MLVYICVASLQKGPHVARAGKNHDFFKKVMIFLI